MSSASVAAPPPTCPRPAAASGRILPRAFPRPHVVAFPRVGAVEHLQVEVRAHRVGRGEGIAAEAEVRGDEFRKREEHDGDFVGMRDEGVVARASGAAHAPRLARGAGPGGTPSSSSRTPSTELRTRRGWASSRTDRRRRRVGTWRPGRRTRRRGGSPGASPRGWRPRGPGGNRAGTSRPSRRRRRRRDPRASPTPSWPGRDRPRRLRGGTRRRRRRRGGGGGRGGVGRGCGGRGGDHRGRVLRRGRRWTRGEVRVDRAESVRGDPVVGEVELGEEHLELPLLQAEAGVRGEDSRQLGPAIAHRERGTR